MANLDPNVAAREAFRRNVEVDVLDVEERIDSCEGEELRFGSSVSGFRITSSMTAEAEGADLLFEGLELVADTTVVATELVDEVVLYSGRCGVRCEEGTWRR